jgi:hypothetical protein
MRGRQDDDEARQDDDEARQDDELPQERLGTHASM